MATATPAPAICCFRRGLLWRVVADYSCELGVCGACEQRVISGIPEHRDSILSEEEQAENKRVMICCAGCKTDRLVLDR
jgi:tetrachlorobenzoquinone reductase